MGKKTDELMQILKEKPDSASYLKEYKQELLCQTLPELLNFFLEQKDLSKAAAIRSSGLDRTYAYQIFDGRQHNPGRDKLLCLAFGLRLTVPETQQLLKTAQLPPLYPRVVRDVLILESLFQGKSLLNCNENLLANSQQPLQ